MEAEERVLYWTQMEQWKRERNETTCLLGAYTTQQLTVILLRSIWHSLYLHKKDGLLEHVDYGWKLKKQPHNYVGNVRSTSSNDALLNSLQIALTVLTIEV